MIGRNNRSAIEAGVDGRLWVLNRNTDPQFLVEILNDAELRLALPEVADGILGIDRRRGKLGTRIFSHGVERQEGPVLPGEDVNSETVPVGGAIEMANTRRVGIAFIRIRAARPGKEVEFPIHCKMGGGIGIALNEERDAALAGGLAELLHMVKRRVGQRNAAEAR